MALIFARLCAALYLSCLLFAAPAYALTGPLWGLCALCFLLAHMGRGRA